MSLPLPLPKSRAHIAHIQSERKKNAFALAKTVPWYRDKLAGIDADALDDPAEWQKIPILDKDTLRKFSHAELLEAFCAVPDDQIAEYWRSGGSTGQPVFYPRTADDLRYGELSWGRSFPCIGIGPGDLCHISFPLGVHPAGQVWARSAKMFGVGMVWVGAGNSYPSVAQLELIQNTAADGVHRDEQLCAPSRQSRRGEGHRSCGKLGAQACLLGRNAVGREARKALPALGRRGVRRLRHERSRLDGRGKFRARRHSYLDGHVFHRSRRCRDRSLVARGRSRHTLCHAALDQSRDAVSALEFRRSGQLRVALGRQRPFRGAFSGDPACQPHHRIFQGARRQRQSRGIRGHDVPQCARARLSSRPGNRAQDRPGKPARADRDQGRERAAGGLRGSCARPSKRPSRFRLCCKCSSAAVLPRNSNAA